MILLMVSSEQRNLGLRHILQLHLFIMCLFFSAHLQDEQEEEVCVGYFLELLKQVDRQKGDDVVLGSHDAVILEEDEGEIKLR